MPYLKSCGFLRLQTAHSNRPRHSKYTRGNLWVWLRPLSNKFCREQGQCAQARTLGMNLQFGGAARGFMRSFMLKSQHVAFQAVLHRLPKAWMVPFFGVPTHLPASHPFCCCRTYHQGKIPQEVTSSAILSWHQLASIADKELGKYERLSHGKPVGLVTVSPCGCTSLL